MDKSALVDKIKLLEGLTNDDKADLIGLLRSHKKYGLVWEEKAEDVEERLREQLPVLNEVKERAIVSDNADAPNHILIEGDNLEALTALSYSHEGKIDVIYIDPPYNTGNKDFIYNDSYVDSEDSYRHSKWLSFMHKRLKIAKKLLSNKGVIFVSIDENEDANLKLLCDEIFLERNYLGSITWESTTQPINVGSARFQLQQKTEFVLCYAKSKADKEPFILKIDQTSSPTYPHTGSLGKCRLEIIEKSDAGQYKRDTMKFPIKGQYPREGKRWQIGEDTAKWLVKNNRIEIINGIVKKAIYPEDELDKIKYYPFWSHFSAENVGSALKAKEELNDIMGKAMGFDTVKPTELLKEIFSHFHKDAVILDFFAGSGSTLHSIMKLNEDGGNRQCILVTNNENKICEEVTYVRNKRVINGYTTPKGEHIEGLKRNTLRYYQTELLPREHSPKNMRELMSKATDLLCIKEDLYTEQPMFGRYKTHPKALRYFADAQKQMLILYREEFIPEIVEEIKGMDFGGKKLKVYLYSPGHYAFEDDFFEVQDKVELIALPSAIYKAYKEVLPKAKDKLIELVNEETTEGGTL